MHQAAASNDLARLGKDMLQFTASAESCSTPEAVLDGLHKATNPSCHVNVLGAALFPFRWGDWNGVELGKTVFLHRSAPRGWWDDHLTLSRAQPGAGFMFAQISLAPFTMSELMRMLEPLAADRWPYEVALKHGMRDRLNCPVGGRWIVSYWSRHVLTPRLTQEMRALLFLGATFAAIRLQQLIGPQACRIGKGVSLTPRELAVLRLLSNGQQVGDIARALDLGEETVRSHLKKAQSKLGVRTRTHAIAQAIRRNLIP